MDFRLQTMQSGQEWFKQSFHLLSCQFKQTVSSVADFGVILESIRDFVRCILRPFLEALKEPVLSGVFDRLFLTVQPFARGSFSSFLILSREGARPTAPARCCAIKRSKTQNA